MTRRILLVGLVVVVSVLAEMLLLWADPFNGRPSAVGYILVGMIPTHASLLAFWAAFGGRATPWRLVIGLWVAVAIAWIGMDYCGGSNEELWILLPMQIVPAAVIFFIVRFLGAELRCDGPEETTESVDPRQQWLQFSIGSLFSWTAAVALVLGMASYLPDSILREFRQIASRMDTIVIFSAICLGATLIALGAMWVTLGSRWTPARSAVLLTTGIIAGISLTLAVDMDEPSGLLTFCCAEVVWMTASLLPLRRAGYRLVWRRRVRL